MTARENFTQGNAQRGGGLRTEQKNRIYQQEELAMNTRAHTK